MLLIINSWMRTHCLARSKAQHKRDQAYKSSPIRGKQASFRACPEGVNAPLRCQAQGWLMIFNAYGAVDAVRVQELIIINNKKLGLRTRACYILAYYCFWSFLDSNHARAKMSCVELQEVLSINSRWWSTACPLYRRNWNRNRCV